MMHVLTGEDLVDRAYIARATLGFEALRDHVRRFTPEWAAEITGIPAATIVDLARRYGREPRTFIRVGIGLSRHENGGMAMRSIACLPALTGSWQVAGGGAVLSTGGTFPLNMAAVERKDLLPRPTRTINMIQLGQALLEVTAPPIMGLYVHTSNPATIVPNQTKGLAGLRREDLFTVVHEQVMTDTCRWADVVLPATTFLEHREVRRGYGAMRLYDSRAVAPPPGLAWSNHQLFDALLTRLELDRPGEPRTEDELVDAILAADRDGHLRAQLTARQVAAPRSPTPRLFVDVMPGTADGKVDLCPAALDAATPRGLYHYQPDPGTPAFPLALISPAIAQQISSTFGQLRRAPAVVELAPADAATRGIGDGDTVRIWNQLGEIVCGARVSRHVRAGVAVLPKGTWRFHTVNGAAATAVVSQALTDLGGGPCYNDARVEIARVGAAGA
jgi:anaerobic selenocysteine-containing dehydrogenase